MIKVIEHNDHFHIKSDRKLKIKQLETGRVYSEVIESKDGKRYTYAEVEEETTNG